MGTQSRCVSAVVSWRPRPLYLCLYKSGDSVNKVSKNLAADVGQISRKKRDAPTEDALKGQATTAAFRSARETRATGRNAGLFLHMSRSHH